MQLSSEIVKLMCAQQGVNPAAETWQTDLLNATCRSQEAEKHFETERARYNKRIKFLTDELVKKSATEEFLIKTLSSKETPPMFKAKLRKLMKDAGLSFGMTNDKPQLKGVTQ